MLTPLDKVGEEITNQEVVLGNASHPDFEWSWGSHTPVDLPNGNILVFDNGYNRHFINNSDNPDEDYSRVVEYKVDEKNKTVQQVWSYGKERGKETFSHALSVGSISDRNRKCPFLSRHTSADHKRKRRADSGD